MDPAPGVSYVDKNQSSLSAGEIQRRLNSLPNLEGLFHVQHGHFRWCIEKVCFIPRDDRARCFSPTFALKDSWWLLGLRPFDVSGEREGITLSITRHKLDPGPGSVAVSYVLGLENSRNKIWFKAEENIVFKKGDHDELQTTVLGNLKSFLTDDGEAIEYDVTVLCEIYVAHLSDSRAGGDDEAKVSPVDPSLSSDLVALFASKKVTDVLIEIRNFRVRAHKCVLWARSRTLARLLESGKFHIQLSCDIACLKCVLYYMYSGSFDYLAKNAVFGIGLYETASDLSLTKLRDLLTPHRIEKRCVVLVLGFRNVCTVHHFVLADLPLRSLTSPMTPDKRSGMSVRVQIHQQDTPPGTVAIDIEVVNVYKVFYVFADVSLLNKNRDPPKDVVAELVPGSVRFEDARMFASFAISTEDVLRCLTEDGNLVLRVVCAKYFLRYRTADLPTNVCSPRDDGSGWPDDLSSDMKRLFETAKLSDMQAMVEGQVMKVHRPLLAARSPFFRHLFCERNYQPNRLEIRSVSARTFWILLAYVYCGTIGHIRDLTLEDFKELSKLSFKCRIQSLAALCAQFTSLMGS